MLYRAILSLPVMFFATYCYVPDVKLSCMSVLNFHLVLIGITFGPTNCKNWLTFGGVPDQFSTSLTITQWGILGDLLVFLMQSPADFHDTCRND